MTSQDERIPFPHKLGRGPGCFTQIELLAAFFTVIPAFVELHANGAVRTMSVTFGLLAGVGCFWTIVQFNWHVLRRLLYDASGNEIPRSERVKDGLALLAIVAIALWGIPCYVLGHLIVEAAKLLCRRS